MLRDMQATARLPASGFISRFADLTGVYRAGYLAWIMMLPPAIA